MTHNRNMSSHLSNTVLVRGRGLLCGISKTCNLQHIRCRHHIRNKVHPPAHIGSE